MRKIVALILMNMGCFYHVHSQALEFTRTTTFTPKGDTKTLLFANEKVTDHIYELTFVREASHFSTLFSLGYFNSEISQSSLWPDVEIVDGEYEWDPVRLISQGHTTSQDFIVFGGGIRKSFDLTGSLSAMLQMKMTAFYKPNGSSQRTTNISDINGDSQRYGLDYSQTIFIERALTPFFDLSSSIRYKLSTTWSVLGNVGYRFAPYDSYVTSIHNYTIFDGRIGQSVNRKRGDGMMMTFGLSRAFGK